MDESTMSPAERAVHELLERRERLGYIMGRAKGRLEVAARFVYLQGVQRFGKPSDAHLATFDAIRIVDHFQALALRAVDPRVRSWDDLLR